MVITNPALRYFCSQGIMEKEVNFLMHRRGASFEDAQDAVQNAGLELLRKGPPGNESNIGGYVARVVYCCLLKIFRERRLKKSVLDRASSLGDRVNIGDLRTQEPDSIVSRAEEEYLVRTSGPIRGAIDRLCPSRQRIAWYLGEGFDAEEIAEREGISKIAATTKICRTRQGIAKRLGLRGMRLDGKHCHAYLLPAVLEDN